MSEDALRRGRPARTFQAAMRAACVIVALASPVWAQESDLEDLRRTAAAGADVSVLIEGRVLRSVGVSRP